MHFLSFFYQETHIEFNTEGSLDPPRIDSSQSFCCKESMYFYQILKCKYQPFMCTHIRIRIYSYACYQGRLDSCGQVSDPK